MPDEGSRSPVPPWLQKGSLKPVPEPSERAKRTSGPDQSVHAAKRRRSPSEQTAKPTPKIDPETEKLLHTLLADLSLSRNEIAKRAGVGVATVTRHALAIGRSFDRAPTAAAVANRAYDARARRVELAHLLVEDAHRERSLLADNVGIRTSVDRAQQSRTVGTLVRAVIDLDRLEIDRARLEADARSGSDLDDYLQHLAGGSGEAAGEERAG